MKLAVDAATVTILMSNGIRARCISWKVRALITVVSVRGAVICLTVQSISGLHKKKVSLTLNIKYKNKNITKNITGVSNENRKRLDFTERRSRISRSLF